MTDPTGPSHGVLQAAPLLPDAILGRILAIGMGLWMAPWIRMLTESNHAPGAWRRRHHLRMLPHGGRVALAVAKMGFRIRYSGLQVTRGMLLEAARTKAFRAEVLALSALAIHRMNEWPVSTPPKCTAGGSPCPSPMKSACPEA